MPSAERRFRAAELAGQAEARAAAQDMRGAARLLGESLELEADAERRLRRAHFLTCAREYDEARAELRAAGRALGAADGRPARALAHLEYVQGRWAPALAALKTLRQPWFQDEFLRGVLCARLGKDADARRCLEALRSRADAWPDLLEALQRAVEGDWDSASAAAERAAASPRPLEQPARLESARTALKLKAWQARAGAAAPRAVPDAPRGRLRLISLGADPPRNVTLDALQAVAGCDVLFVNLASDTLMDLLATFCAGEVRPINFVDEESREGCARKVLAAMGPGRTVGYATYGHVMVYGPLTMLLTKTCRERGIPYDAWAGVSIVDRVLADSGVVLGDGFMGFQLYDVRDLAARKVPLDGAAALALYLTDDWKDDRAAFFAAVQERLLEAYPPGREALLWGPEGLVKRLRVDAVAAAGPLLTSQRQLFIPARDGDGSGGRTESPRRSRRTRSTDRKG